MNKWKPNAVWDSTKMEKMLHGRDPAPRNPKPLVSLVVPPSRTNTNRMPLGLMQISACLTERGIDNEIIDPKSSSNPERDVVGELLISKPDWVGVTCCATEIYEVKGLCYIIRGMFPKAKIVLGGPHPSYRPEHFTEIGVDFDYIVRGEGEFTLGTIVEDGIRTQPPAVVTGGTWDQLDTWPMPAYDKIDMEYYSRPNVWSVRFIPLAAVGVFASRGCPFRCKFCVAHAVFGRKIRRHGPFRVGMMVTYLVKTYGLDGIYFNDECFTADKVWVRDICGLITPLNILWGCQTRVHMIDDDLVRIMKDAGCVQIDFGIESGSDRLLRSMRKGIKVSQVKEAFRICKKHGVRTLANMMVNIPGETLEDIELSRQLLNEIEPNVVFWNVYCPIPGVDYGREMELNDLRLGADKNLDLLNIKYKFGDYDESLQSLVGRLRREWPSPPKMEITWNLKYYLRWFRMFSFVFTIRYWRIIWRSKRRWQYFNVRQLLGQKNRR